MNSEKAEYLASTYPLLYSQGIYFEYLDGWFDLINKLSRKLEDLIKLEPEPEIFFATQVKEKYATLRFYMSYQTQEMLTAIYEAEGESARTCEVCGEPGKINKGSWYQTLCEKHMR